MIIVCFCCILHPFRIIFLLLCLCSSNYLRMSLFIVSLERVLSCTVQYSVHPPIYVTKVPISNTAFNVQC